MNAQTQIIPRDTASLAEAVITKGDLDKLSSQERTAYYMAVCESVGLNPLTKPFEYIKLNGRLVLYALRNATDQLRQIHGISVVELSETEREGVYIVTAKVSNRDGRTDIAKGAVALSNLKGDALANALMKAETKAKRRATLSICGLSMLDETEVEAVPVRSNGNGHAIEADTGELVTDEQIKALQAAIMEVDADLPKFLKYLGVASLGDLPASRYEGALAALHAKRAKS